MQRILTILLSSTLLTLSSTMAIANEDTDLDELLAMDIDELVVVAASKRLEKTSDAPGIITVVTEKDIKTYGGKTLFDVLSRLPNMAVIRGTPLSWGSMSFNTRGQTPDSSDTRTLLLLNGRPMRESQYGGWTQAIYNTFPLEMIERIEVIRGPGSVLYGSNAYSGVVNIVTKTANNSQEDETFISYGYGSYNTHQTNISYRRSFDKGNINAGFNIHDTDGWDLSFTDALGVTDSARLFRDDYSGVVNVNYDNFTINLFRGSTHGLASGVFPYWPAGVHEQRRDFIDIGYEHPLNEIWSANFNVTYNGFNNFARTAIFPDADKNDFDDLLYEVSLSGTPHDNLNIISGVTYESRHGVLESGGGKYTQWVGSGYFQADYRYNDYLSLIAGLQANKPDGSDLDLSPRAGAILRFTPNWGAKILHGKAFRSPSAADLQINIPLVDGNPNLSPETINTTDIQLFFQNKDYYAALTYYRSVAKGTILTTLNTDPTATKPVTFINGGTYKYQGIELEGKAKITSQWEINGSLSYQQGKDQETGSHDISRTPHLMAKAGTSYHFSKGCNISFFNQYFSKGEANSVVIGGQTRTNTDGYNLATAKLDLDVNSILNLPALPETSISLFIDNLLDDNIEIIDATNSQTPVYQYSGRAFYGKVSIKF